MIVIHENVTAYTAKKPVKCPKCNYNRTFDVPVGAFVRKAKRGKPPIDAVYIKCAKCGKHIGISTARDISADT